MKFYIMCCVLATSVMNFYAQDIHWSQINEIKSFQNQASIIENPEEIKFQLVAKNQWKSVTKPYQTLFGSIESKLRNINHISLCLNLYSDLVGDGYFNTNGTNFIAKYDFKISRKIKIGCGFSIGLINRNISYSNFNFDNQFNGYQFDKTIPTNEQYQNTSYTNLNIGFGINSILKLKKNQKITIGYSCNNLNKLKETFYQNNIIRPTRHSVQFEYRTILNTIEYKPFIVYTFQKPYQELLIGSLITKYRLKSKINSIISGIYYRNKDAMILNLGFSRQKLKMILSYDINISKLAIASNGRGSVEINLQYLLSKKELKIPITTKCSEFY